MQPRTMAVNVKLTVVVDNHVADTRLLGEHGLALWAETAAGNVLSDAGQGLTIEHNLRQLGIDPKRADAVVISHGHYDHTGGLDFVWEYAHGAELFLHPGAMAAKYARHENAVDEIGMPRSVREQIRRDKWRIVWTREHRRVLPGVFVTGQIPRVSGFEDDGGVFLLDGKGEVQDGLEDDQALWVETPTGLVVLLGCAHSGVINTLRYILELTHADEIRAVVGGMHLGSASEDRLFRTLAGMHELNVRALYPCHCTGPVATARLMNALPGICHPCGAGTVLEL